MTGRFSKYPKVDRSRPAWPATAAERLAQARGAAPAPTAAGDATRPSRDDTDSVAGGEAVEVPNVDAMTVAQVLEWVGDDQDRAAAAVTAERAGRNRRGIMDVLGG